MIRPKLSSRWFVLAIVSVSMAAVFAFGFTEAAFNDVVTSQSNTVAAWASANWTQTTQTDFNAGNLSNVDATTSQGNVTLLLASTNSTLSPGANNTGSWTGPANAFANGGSAANITSGSPSGSTVWGNYGFNFNGNVTSVRIQYDAWSIGNVTKNQTALPVSDYSINGTWAVNPTSPTTRWDKVDDPLVTPDNGRTCVVLQSNAGGDVTFNSTFNIPAGSNITSLVVYFRASDNVSGTNDIRATLVVGGSTFRNAGGNNPPSPGAWTTFNDTYTTNPQTGAAWMVDDINGVGANPLQAFGVGCTDGNPDVNVSQIYAVVNYRTANDEEINIDVSWNGGINWSAVQTTALTGTQTTYSYDVTAATNWTSAKLADGSLQVRAAAQTVGDNGTVYLDWIPVEVLYDAYRSSGTFASQVFNTNVTGSRWDGLFWDKYLPSGTNVTFEVRASDVSFLKTDAAPSWTSLGSVSPVISGLPSGRYKQWRSILTTLNSSRSPVLNEVRLYYYGPQ